MGSKGEWIIKVAPPHVCEPPYQGSQPEYWECGTGSVWLCNCGTRWLFTNKVDGQWEATRG